MTPQERETMQMALDVLDDINQCSLPPTGIPLPAEIDEAMDSLRAALAAPPQELDLPKVQLWEFLKLIEGKEDFRGIPLMRTEWPTQGEALAQPPCATGAQCVGNKCERCAVQEREWVGLTDEERKEIIRQQKDFWGPVGWELECVRAIEAKLREKNFDRPS